MSGSAVLSLILLLKVFMLRCSEGFSCLLSSCVSFERPVQPPTLLQNVKEQPAS